MLINYFTLHPFLVAANLVTQEPLLRTGTFADKLLYTASFFGCSKFSNSGAVAAHGHFC
jgi:hypothetical protein